MTFESWMRLGLGVLILFVLARLARAVITGRIRTAGLTYSRAMTPRPYWRELTVDGLTLALLALLTFRWETIKESGWMALVLVSAALISNLVRLAVPDRPTPPEQRLRRDEIGILLSMLLLAATALLLIMDWLGP
jgi:hypothetical protein